MDAGEKTVRLYDKYIIPCYSRNPVVIVRGSGSWIWDSSGKRYLDLFPGWGVNGLGHCHPDVVKAVKRQISRLMHMPNNYYNEPQGKLAELLIKNSFPGKCFFCNSGAEANEAAIKLARKYGNTKGRYEIVTFYNSFHGRTIAAVAATAQKKYRRGFAPLPKGFRHAEFGSIRALRNALRPQTAAVLIEPIQGEGGIQTATKEYFKELRSLCSRRGILLMFDEVQTGMGRTGRMFCYKHFGIRPDVMTLAKALGGGIAIGALIAGDPFSGILSPGTHASTFGGNPAACSAAVSVIEIMERDAVLKNVRRQGNYLWKRLRDVKRRFPHIIRQIRGMGLMVGVELNIKGADIVKRCMDMGLIINCTHETVIRIMPALTVAKEEIDTGLAIFEKVLRNYEG